MSATAEPGKEAELLPGYFTPGPALSGSASPRSPAVAQLIEHSYSLEQKGRTWITLKVQNSRAALSRHLPVFCEGDEIKGVVEIDIQKAESAKSVTIGVVAGTTYVGQDEVPFLSITQELWAPTSASPKLQSKMSWPFAIKLPREVEAAEEEKGPKSTYSMPPSFSERASPTYIDYRMVVTVKRGALKVNNTLGTSFAYLPRTRPGPPSELRLQAYREGSGLIGPDADPAGWKTLPTVQVNGTVFESREIDLSCKLSVASPLAYAMGSPIPLSLTLSCVDAQALDLLAKPDSIRLQLVRTLAIGTGAMQDTASSAVRRSNNTFPEVIGHAVWWPVGAEAHAEGDTGQTQTIRLEGELEVKKGIKPNFLFPRVSIWYNLVLLAPAASGFSPLGGADEPLLTEKVAVTTGSAPGVVPRSFRAARVRR